MLLVQNKCFLIKHHEFCIFLFKNHERKGTRGQAIYGPRGKTEACQPVDAGHLGAVMKSCFREEQEAWLDLKRIKPGTVDEEEPISYFKQQCYKHL